MISDFVALYLRNVFDSGDEGLCVSTSLDKLSIDDMTDAEKYPHMQRILHDMEAYKLISREDMDRMTVNIRGSWEELLYGSWLGIMANNFAVRMSNMGYVTLEYGKNHALHAHITPAGTDELLAHEATIPTQTDSKGTV